MHIGSAVRILVARVSQRHTTASAIREAVARMRIYCEVHSVPSRPIIQSGYPKSGNTWTRLVYYNMIAVAKSGAIKTMTYTRLNRVAPNHSFPNGMIQNGFVEPIDFDNSGFPLLFTTHDQWEPFWDDIGDVLFVERHPLDALIGHWYNIIAFPEVPYEHIDIDAFVLRELPDWIDRYQINKPRAKAYLRYEDAVSDPQRAFGSAFRALGVPFAAAQLQQAIGMTSFERVQAMEDSNGEHHGHVSDPIRMMSVGDRPWKRQPGVRFTRSGKVGQWRHELKEDTVERGIAILEAAGLTEFTNNHRAEEMTGTGAVVSEHEGALLI